MKIKLLDTKVVNPEVMPDNREVCKFIDNGIPTKEEKEKKKSINLVIPMKLFIRVEEERKKRPGNVSATQYIIEAIHEYLPENSD